MTTGVVDKANPASRAKPNTRQLLSGQFCATVDWVAKNGKEVGLFLKVGADRQSRVILCGDVVRRQLVNNQLLVKGAVVSGFGHLAARCIERDGEPAIPEILCDAAHLSVEPQRTVRTANSLYAIMRGVVMYWQSDTSMLKTFLNFGEGGEAALHGQPARVTCSVALRSFMGQLGEEKRTKLVNTIYPGREFSAAGLLEVDYYRAKTAGYGVEAGAYVPVLQLMALDMRLQ